MIEEKIRVRHEPGAGIIPDSAVRFAPHVIEARAWSSEGTEAYSFKALFGTRHSVPQWLGTRLMAPLLATPSEAGTH
jgi:hypothetical protein